MCNDRHGTALSLSLSHYLSVYVWYRFLFRSSNTARTVFSLVFFFDIIVIVIIIIIVKEREIIILKSILNCQLFVLDSP
jgi:hypothetical protein